jgi:RND family efflux transporter MFP subunit
MSDQLSADLRSLKIDRDRPPSKGRLKLVIYVAAAAGVIAAIYFVAVPYITQKIYKTEVDVTEISLVSPAQGSIELTSSGYVVPQTKSDVSAKVAGKVTKVLVKQGQRVTAGDVMFELDVADQNAAIAAAKSQVAASRAQAQTARATLAEAKLQAERARALHEQGVSPKAAADDLEARVKSLKASVYAADAATRAAAAQVKALEVTLEGFAVIAPITGTIVGEPPELGEFVGPQMGGFGGISGTIEISDFESLQVETDVPEARLHLVKMNGPCEIVLDAYPSVRRPGRVLEIVPKVNRAKATVMVKVGFTEGVENVLPEMSARVSFLTEELDADALKEPPKLVVPSSALAEREGGKVVFVIEGESVRMTPVTVGEPFGAGFVLVSGPPAGTHVVKEPSKDLSDGQRVKERDDG